MSWQIARHKVHMDPCFGDFPGRGLHEVLEESQPRRLGWWGCASQELHKRAREICQALLEMPRAGDNFLEEIPVELGQHRPEATSWANLVVSCCKRWN